MPLTPPRTVRAAAVTTVAAVTGCLALVGPVPASQATSVATLTARPSTTAHAATALATTTHPTTTTPIATPRAADRSGALKLRVVGLPGGSAVVRVTGPGYRQTAEIRGNRVLVRLRPGTYRVRARTLERDGVAYVPTKTPWTVQVSPGRRARLAVAFRTATPSPAPPAPTTTPTAPPVPTVAPAVPAPPGLISDVLDRINAARASGVRCDGSTGPALPPIGYNAQLGELARWHADDFVAQRDNDFLADLTRSGYSGAFVAESAVICPKVADADGVIAAMLDWAPSCGHIFDPAVDRIGIAYADGGGVTNAWVLTFGRSSSG